MTNTVSCGLREGDIAIEMEAIQKRYPTVEIGSYPVMRPEGGFSLSLVLRGIDESALEEATHALATLIKKIGDDPIIARQRPPVA